MARLLDSKYTETISATATSALATRFCFVKFNTDEADVVVAGAVDKAIGVNITTASAGEKISVVTNGIVRVHLGGTIADQSYVQAGASGYAYQGMAGEILGFMPVGGAVGEERSVFLHQAPSNGVIVGTAVASATTIVPTGNVFHVTGTTTMTTLTGTAVKTGGMVTIIFDGSATFSPGGASLGATANDTITLCWDGTSWFEMSRSVNA